jgi:hypothetical protein
MTCDAGDEVKREIRPEDLGVPKPVLDKASEKASSSGGNTPPETQLLDDKPE